jgi:copper chaperone
LDNQPIPERDPQANQSCLLGVKSFDVNLEKQTADVVAEDKLDYNTVLSTIKKTGKKVNTGEADGKEMPIEIAAAA